jgi:hypothetical protein
MAAPIRHTVFIVAPLIWPDRQARPALSQLPPAVLSELALTRKLRVVRIALLRIPDFLFGRHLRLLIAAEFFFRLPAGVFDIVRH